MSMDLGRLKAISIFASRDDGTSCGVATFATATWAPSGKQLVKQEDHAHEFMAIDPREARMVRDPEPSATFGRRDLRGPIGVLETSMRTTSPVGAGGVHVG